ncbi:MAG: glycosyltransferase family 2 protein [Sphingomonadales bacterium]|nr:glycosyltransferase family 2 protein [Sphingomonadales bacterium]
MRALAILTVKNEAAFLLEWLAHHRAVGFTDFLVFSNDCSDGTAEMLDRLAAMGEITHQPNPGPWPQGPQWAALKAADRHPLTARADWVMVLDVDEFVTIHVGDGTLGALIAALPEATAIPLTWRLFGNCGVVEFADHPVTAQFPRAAPAGMTWPWRAAMIKTLFRNDGSYGKLGVHRPRAPDPARMGAQRWFDGSGRELPALYHRQRLFTPLGQDSYALAQLNHYALGSMEGYLVKCDRGRANREAATFDMSYWTERNFCTVEDPSIRRYDGPAGAIRARLMADATLARLHERGVAWRRARIAALLMQDEFRQLFGRLMLTPPARPLPPAAAARMLRLAQAAQAVGDGTETMRDPGAD